MWTFTSTFPEEKCFEAPDYSAQSATFFIAELLRNGVTTTLAFATSHSESVQALFTEANARQLRLITSLCLMDRNAPVEVLNRGAPDGSRNATEQSLIDTEALIKQWHGKGRLGYAITPRFAPSCSEAQQPGRTVVRHDRAGR